MLYFKIKVDACMSIHPIRDYIFWANYSKIPYFTYNAKEDCNSIDALKFPSRHVGRKI